MATVLVAGATGHLGSHVVCALVARGHHVRALARDPRRLADLAARHPPGTVVPLPADLARADAPALAALARACEGADAVLSCAGAPLDVGGAALRDRRTFDAVDRDGNRRLAAAAAEAGAGRFVYVSLFGGPGLRHTAYAAAHEAVVDALAAGRLPHTVVRPTGYFWFFDEVLRQAIAGRGLVLGDGSARTNPIHEAELAELCADAALDGPAELPVGGPTVLTRREITELALAAAGRAPRATAVPAGVVRAAATVLRPFHPRLSALLDFGAAVAVEDAVAPPHGRRELGAYFVERARELRGA